MKSSVKKSLGIVVMALLLCLSGCGRQPVESGSATAENIPAATPEELTVTQETLTLTPVETVTVTPEPAAQPAADALFQTPCIDAPYDYEYSAADKQIAIRRFETDGITYFIADVQITNVSQFQTALSGGKPGGELETASAMAQRNGAVLAINADDYGVHKYGTIIRNGALLRTHDTTRNMLIVDANGDFSVRVDRKNENPAQLGEELLAQNVWQTFEFGPELIRDGQAVTFSRDFDLISTKETRREPRTAIGQIGPLHYVIVVADGRQDGYSKGMTLTELQDVLLACGAKTAMNLDGGGSAEMWFNGTVINRPSGGKERKLSDILFF